MNVLRIKLKQSKAHYRKAETIENKMTYPLPPYSTVIGALHVACGFKEYHPMDISIQGSYESKQKEAYIDHAYFDSVMDDRGILVKIPNSEYRSRGFEVVAKSLKKGSSFEKDESIEVVDEKHLNEYRSLKQLSRELIKENSEVIKLKVDELSLKKKDLILEQKEFDKKDPEFLELKQKIEKIRLEKEKIEEEFKSRKQQEYEIPYSKFANLNTSLKFYECLYNVNLVIHIRTNEKDMKVIEENMMNLVALGRSEDFVDLIECKQVELSQEIDEELINNESGYIELKIAKNENVITRDLSALKANGTVFVLDKNYELMNGKRNFNKKTVLYVSEYILDEESFDDLPETCKNSLFTDGEYIVDLV